MKAKDIVEHFLSRANWIDRRITADRVVAGDPEADFDRCFVTWMPEMGVLKHMAKSDIHLLVCHEPTFWGHRDDELANDPACVQKMRFINDHGLVIVRNHDCWDRWPEHGIPWAWARFLGFGQTPVKVSTDAYQHRYDIEPVSLDDFADRVAKRCTPLGEPQVQVTGDGWQKVSRIGIGTGCLCEIKQYQAMGCDCSIVVDDGTAYWRDIQKAAEFSHPVIRVHHGTAEEPGMVTLTKYLNDHIKGLRAEHFPHHGTFRLTGRAVH